MKPHLLFSLLLSVFSASAMATPTSQHDRLAENGPDRLVQQFQRV